MFVSIIIPTYNEASSIEKIIRHLQQNSVGQDYEIIISDGASTDGTIAIAENLGVKALVSDVKGRAGQMNFGVKNAIGDIYFFIHADSLPHPLFVEAIKKALTEGFNCGSFRTQFDSDRFLLKINAFFTRFNYLFFRGGDQGIFVTKKLWNQTGGFKEEMLIMEDYDFIQRLWERGKFKLIQKCTLISARKYEQNSYLTVQLANLKIVKMYKKGASQNAMVSKYKELLSYRKNAF